MSISPATPAYFQGPRWTESLAELRPAFAGQRVLVTGGGGFLGRWVCALLESLGAEPYAPRSAEFNLSEQAQVRALFRDAQCPIVLHLAAACGGIAANLADPGRFLYENALMGLLILEEARLSGVKKLVLVSTTCAYPEGAPIPLREDQIWEGKPTPATGAYGLAKRLLHEALATYRAQYGFDGVTVIPTNLYGPGDHFDPERSHVVAALIRRFVEATERELPEVCNWGSGRPTREFLHVADAAVGILRAAKDYSDPNPVNLGTGVETSIAELSSLIVSATGYGGEVRWDTTRPEGQPRRCLDVSRAAGFGITAQISLADGLQESVDWFRQPRGR